MSEKAEKKPESPPPAKDTAEKEGGEKKKAGAGALGKTPVLLGIVMILEAVVLFAGFKFLGGGPKAVVAVELKEEHAEDKKDAHGDSHGEKDDSHGKAGAKPEKGKTKGVELAVVDMKAPNSQTGRRYIYDVSIFASVKGDSEKVKEAIKAQDARIKDRVRTIIAQMDPDKLGGGTEPGLETLRRQVKAQLEIILGDDMIDEVLVPKCNPFRSEI